MRPFKNHHWYFLLAVLVLIVYGRTVWQSLLWWDDRQHICQNPLFADLSWRNFSDIWSRPYFGLYAPLAYSLWILPYEIARNLWTDCMSSGPLFHALNLLLHVLNALLVLSLLQKLFPNRAKVLPFLGALIFALHPLQVETVSWISAQRDLLAASLGLTALNLFMDKKNKGATVCFALSLLAKPTAVVFPMLALILPLTGDQDSRQKRFRSLLPAFLVCGMAAVVAKTIQADPLLHFDLLWWQRSLVFMQAIGFYIWKLLIPWNLVPAYKRSVLDLQNDFSLYWVAAWVLVPMALAFRSRDLRPAFFWILVALLPVSGLISFGFQEISTVADRYFYVPMIGVSWALLTLLSERKALFAGVVLFALAGLSFHQVGYWKDDATLFEHNVDVEPEIAMVHSNLGNAYFHSQSYERAENEFELSLRLNNHESQSWLGLARVYDKTNRLEKAKSTYEKSIEMASALPETYNNLAVIHYSLGNQSEAEKNWQIARQLSPVYFEPRYNLGILYSQQSRPEEARRALEEALRISPHHALAIEKLKSLH